MCISGCESWWGHWLFPVTSVAYCSTSDQLLDWRHMSMQVQQVELVLWLELKLIWLMLTLWFPVWRAPHREEFITIVCCHGHGCSTLRMQERDNRKLVEKHGIHKLQSWKVTDSYWLSNLITWNTLIDSHAVSEKALACKCTASLNSYIKMMKCDDEQPGLY